MVFIPLNIFLKITMMMADKMGNPSNETEILMNENNDTGTSVETEMSEMPVKVKRILIFCLMALLFILSVMMIVIMLEGDGGP